MFFSALEFINYLIRGKSIYRLHSPFAFGLANTVLNDRLRYYAFAPIERRREMLLDNRSTIRIADFGAGSDGSNGKVTSLSAMTRKSAVPPLYGRMLFRLALHFKPATILEMGSCTGIGTLYLSTPGVQDKMISLEGDPQLAAAARESLAAFPLSHPRAEIREGEFGTTLDKALADLGRIDLAYIDGNHRKAPTLDYFERIVARCHSESVLVFDDIHWSREMAEAWQAIKADQRVRVTIDLYRMGLVFFKEEVRVKQDFKLYYW